MPGGGSIFLETLGARGGAAVGAAAAIALAAVLSFEILLPAAPVALAAARAPACGLAQITGRRRRCSGRDRSVFGHVAVSSWISYHQVVEKPNGL
jgi:hypothetical protein